MRPSVEKLKRMSKTKAMRLENSLASDCDYGEMINPIKPVKACFVWTKPLFSYKRKSTSSLYFWAKGPISCILTVEQRPYKNLSTHTLVKVL